MICYFCSWELRCSLASSSSTSVVVSVGVWDSLFYVSEGGTLFKLRQQFNRQRIFESVPLLAQILPICTMKLKIFHWWKFKRLHWWKLNCHNIDEPTRCRKGAGRRQDPLGWRELQWWTLEDAKIPSGAKRGNRSRRTPRSLWVPKSVHWWKINAVIVLFFSSTSYLFLA